MSDDNDILTPQERADLNVDAAPPVLSRRTTIGIVSGLALVIAVAGVAVTRDSDSSSDSAYVALDAPSNALYTGLGGELVGPHQELETFVRLPDGMTQVGDIEITGDASGHFVVLEDVTARDDDGRLRVTIHVANSDDEEHRFEARVWFRMANGEPAEAPDAGDGEMDGGL